jgi:protein-disulfide isomerase
MSILRPPVSAQDQSAGPKDARVTLVEYGDYQCPYCGEAFPVVKMLQERFAADLRFVFRNFPLSEAHPHAEHAAESALFAAKQGKFWEMHDLLYQHQQRLSDDGLLQLAGSLQLDAHRLGQDLAVGTYRSLVKADFTSGARSGVNGTPTFFINGQRHDSGFDVETLAQAIDAVI